MNTVNEKENLKHFWTRQECIEYLHQIRDDTLLKDGSCRTFVIDFNKVSDNFIKKEMEYQLDRTIVIKGNYK